MTFVIKKLSEHGTTNPIVARLSVQASEIINFFHLEKDKRDQILDAYFYHIKPRVIKCDEISKSITEESEQIIADILENKLSSQSNGRVIELPQVKELVSRSENFLYNAKSSLRDIAKIFKPLFGIEFTHSRYDEIRKKMEEKLGPDSALVKQLKEDEPWIKDVIDMRNAVEHPSSKLGQLNISNVELVNTNEKGQRFFQRPVWYFDGKEPSSICSDMNVITDNILRFAEDILVVSYIQLNPNSAVQFAEIPEKERDQSCPIRLRAVLDQSKLKPNNAPQSDA